MSKPPEGIKKITEDEKKKVTVKARDKALSKQTLVMPVRVYYIASAKGDFMATAPCKLWDPGEVKTIFNRGAGLMNRLFNIKLELVSPLIKIDVPVMEDVYYHAVDGFNKQHQQFNRVAGRGGGGSVHFSKKEIHILFLGRIYDDKRITASAKGVALNLTHATRDYNLGGHKVVMGYVHRGQLKSPGERKNNCTITGDMKADLITQSAVLVHELGHCLHLRHLQDEPADRLGNNKNLSNNIMDRDVDPIKPGKKGPASPGLHEYRVLEFQYRAARRYGRCAGYFKNVGPKSGDYCPTLFQDLGFDAADLK